MERWTAWGKLTRSENNNCRIHPLIDHMIDVACVFGALIEQISIRRSLERAAGRPLTSADIARLQVLVFLHDIGKVNSGFQCRYWQTASERPRWWLAAPTGHGPEGWSLFSGSLYGSARLTAGLPVERMN